MTKNKVSMDGFVPRRQNRKVGVVIGDKPEKNSIRQRLQLRDTDHAPLGLTRAKISRAEIDESLRVIDESEAHEAPRHRNSVKVQSSKKKWIKRLLIVIAVLVLAAGSYVGFKTIIASGNVFQGSLIDVFQNVPLQQDENGRTNVIIVGTSEDDPGHQGASLTDSMLILSLDQNKKNAFMISIPRDLYVRYGTACNSGYMGRINEYYDCVREGVGVDADREALKKEADFVGNIVGLEVQYGVNVNYTVMRELVNAVGGSITVTIESRDPRGQMDSNFDWKCGVGDRKVSRAEVLRRCPPNGHFIDFPNGPVTLDAERALYLAQARGDSAPTYGFEQSNFDREKNQQKIIKALREKAVSAGVLADFGKVSAVIDALGNNLRTTFETKEFRTLVSLAQDIKSEDIKSISLIDGDSPAVGTGMVNGMSVVRPNAGTFDYTQLQELIQKRLSSDPIVSEAAPIAIFNASGISGLAKIQADKLELANYTVAQIDSITTVASKQYALYKIGEGNKGTAEKLQQLFGVKITSGKPPVTVNGDVRFVLIIGPPPTSDSVN
jgi:anionic cell wall polymer biosynthesis LytR-Cps2A-Psr (LCP) family protein